MRVLAIALVLVTATPVQAENHYSFAGSGNRLPRVQYNNQADKKFVIDSGWYVDDPAAHQIANTNYIVGFLGSTEFRNFFVVDLSRVPRNLTLRSFDLVLDQPAGGGPSFGAVGTPFRFNLYDVTTPISSLRDGSGDPFDDLGSGVLFGSFLIAPDGGGTTLRFRLNDAGLAAANAARRGMFAIGGAVVPPTAVPEPGVWLLYLAGFALAGGSLRRRRNAIGNAAGGSIRG